MKNKSVNSEVLEASQQWIKLFNLGDIKACSFKYLNNAVMVVNPVGKYEGRQEIQEFWDTFVKSSQATDLTYSNINIEVVNNDSAKLSAQWLMKGCCGFITEELWVKKEGEWLLSYDDFTIEEQF